MTFDSRNRPAFGSTDWAAQQFMRMLDREERLKRRTRQGTGAGSTYDNTPQQIAQNAGSPTSELSVADLWRLPQQQRPEYARNGPLGDAPNSPIAVNPLPPEARNEFGTDALDAIRLTPENRRAMISRMIDQFEGGYVDDPDDAGGPTHYGITREALKEFQRLLGIGPQAARDAAEKRKATIGPYTPRSLTRQEAEDIHDIIMRGHKIDMIADPALREQVFDMTVNLGSTIGPRLLLDALEDFGHNVRNGLTDDAIGTKALGAVRDLALSRNTGELMRLNNALVDKRRAYYEDSIARDSNNRKFRRGWLNRANSFRILPTGEQR
jgi:type VI secretion system secreted protein VgrG